MSPESIEIPLTLTLSHPGEGTSIAMHPSYP
jgi:hypothetical protein